MAPRPQRQPRLGLSGRTLALVATVALALSAATCGDDEDPPDDTTSTTEADSSSSTTLSPEEEVEAAYLAFADMGTRLLQAPNPEDPEIAQRASGEALGDLVDGLTTLRASNQRYELGPAYGQEVLGVSVTADSATAEVCVIEDSSRVEATTGEEIARGVTTSRWSATLLRTDQGWLVDEITEEENWDGEVACT